MEKLKKKEIVKTAILLVIIVIGTAGFVLGLRAALRIEYPLMVVASESMVPTLNIGDIIVVYGGLNTSEINAAPAPEGDMIVFREPGNPNNFIVHRAIGKTNGWFTTKGDNNPTPDVWYGFPKGVPEDYIIGKVMGRFPLIGYLILFLRTPWGFIVFIILVVIFMFQEYIFHKKRE